jgi:hypothetical protein
VEARDQLRLVSVIRMGHPNIKWDTFIDDLNRQAYPPDFDEAKAIGLSGFIKAMEMWGKKEKDVKNDISGFVEYPKTLTE